LIYNSNIISQSRKRHNHTAAMDYKDLIVVLAPELLFAEPFGW